MKKIRKKVYVSPDTHQILNFMKTELKVRGIEEVIQYLIKIELKYQEMVNKWYSQKYIYHCGVVQKPYGGWNIN